MYVENEYKKIYNTHIALLDNRQKLIIRAASVSRSDLIEICKEDYDNNEREIIETEGKLNLIEKKYLDYLVDIWFGDLEKFYENNFSVSNLHSVLYTQNIDIKELTDKFRMRPIIDISQKRYINILLSLINCKIKIIDYMSQLAEYIGINGDYELVIRCKGFVDINLDTNVIIE